MISNCFPLYDDGEIGYFDHSACLYPNGSIEKVWFEGYIDETEEQMQQRFKLEKGNIKYPYPCAS